MNIILTNLGNRNISFRGKIFAECRDEEKFHVSNFRDFTKTLLDKFEEYKDDISLNILPDLIHGLDSQPDKLYIFYTDSPEGERSNQDTLYEADILKKKLPELYPCLDIISLPLKCRPTDADSMIRRYRGHLKNIIKNLHLTEVIICESGGTPQQKFALKIISEFLFDSAILRSYSVEIGVHEKKFIRKQPSIEYKNIIIEEQVSALISTGDFSGALTLMTHKNASNPNTKLMRLMELAYFLMKNDVKKALTVLKANSIEGFSITDENKKLLSDLFIFKKSYQIYSQLISEKEHLTCCVLLSIAEWKLKQNLYGESSLFYSIFIENYLSAVINYAAPEYEVDGFNEKFDLFLSAIQQGLIFDGLVFPEYIDLQKGASLPFKIVVADFINDDLNKKVLFEIKQVNSHFKKMRGEKSTTGLDSLRNKYAHKGKHISLDDFKPFITFSNNIHQLFKMPEISIFDILINSAFELMV
jgi:hypothetical protein